MDLTGPRKADPPVHLRRILVYSSASAAGAAKARARKLAKATADLDRLVRTAGTRFHPTAGAVAARVTAIAASTARQGVSACRDHPGRLRQTSAVLAFRSGCARRRSRHRRLVRPAGQPGPGQARAAEIFRRYKGQHIAERRYGEFKGPLAVAPLFLKTNRRIAALITVICLALLIFCLIERQVRNALRPHDGMMTGLPGYRTIVARPTGRTIFQALADLRLIPAHDGNPRHDSQTHRRPGPAAGPPRHRHQPTPLAHQVKSHVRRTRLVGTAAGHVATQIAPL